jgi:hypothetical protein
MLTFCHRKALKWFPANGGEPEDYNEGRDLDSLAALYALLLFFLPSATNMAF